MPNNRWLTKGKCGKSERQKEEKKIGKVVAQTITLQLQRQ